MIVTYYPKEIGLKLEWFSSFVSWFYALHLLIKLMVSCCLIIFACHFTFGKLNHSDLKHKVNSKWFDD